jgi:uncharacterized protein (TIGR03437 family)
LVQTVIAPGQVTTLSVYGGSTIVPPNSSNFSQIQASQVPLPTTLGGFSATIQQAPYQIYTAALPMFNVQQQNICAPGSLPIPSCLLTFLTVQIPIDLVVSPSLNTTYEQTIIIVTNTNNDSWVIRALLDPVKVHIITQCEAQAFGMTYLVSPANLSPCNPLITHADGTLVSSLQRVGRPLYTPALPGETLVMYAYGLGPTQPVVPAGTASPVPAAVATRRFSLIFNYDCGTVVAGTPVFVGLTPGQVGLYQVNFLVPQPVNCTAQPSGPGATSGGNLTLLSSDWVSSDTVLLYLGANESASGTSSVLLKK